MMLTVALLVFPAANCLPPPELPPGDLATGLLVSDREKQNPVVWLPDFLCG